MAEPSKHTTKVNLNQPRAMVFWNDTQLGHVTQDCSEIWQSSFVDIVAVWILFPRVTTY